jgi:hypothetical protein
MRIGVAVDQGKLLEGQPCFFTFALDDAIVYEQGIAEVEFVGPATLKMGTSVIGVRAWIEVEGTDLRTRRPDA